MSIILDQNNITADRRAELDAILDDYMAFERIWDSFNVAQRDWLRVTLNSMLQQGVNTSMAVAWLTSIATIFGAFD